VNTVGDEAGHECPTDETRSAGDEGRHLQVALERGVSAERNFVK
jgi:hypothetical protein